MKNIKRGVLVLVSIIVLLALAMTATAQPTALGIFGWVKGPNNYNATVNITAYDQGTTNVLDSKVSHSNKTLDGGYSDSLTIPPGYAYVDINVTASNPPAFGFNDSFTNVSVQFDNPEINVTMHIPIYLLSPANGTTTSDTTPTFVWNQTQGYTQWYRLLIDNELGFNSPLVQNISSISNLNYTLNSSQTLADGTYYWKVQSYNTSVEDESGIFTLTIDTNPPVIVNITPTNDTWTNNPSVTITVTTNESGSCKFANSSGVAFASKPFTMLDVGVTHTVNFTLTEGRNDFYFQCNDTQGNLMNLSDEVYYTLKLDTIPPNATNAVVLIEGGATYATNSTLDFTFSGFNDSIPGIITSGIFGYHYNFTNNENTSGGVFDSNSPGQLSNAPDGNVTVYVWARDNVGNIGLAAWDDIIVDITGTTFSGFSNTEITEDSVGNLTVYVNITDATSGLSGTPRIRYRYNDTTSYSVWLNLTLVSGDQYTFQIPEPPGGWDSNKGQNVSWQFNATDNAGNAAVSPAQMELVDSINDPPVLNPIGNKTVTEDTLLTFNITAYDVDQDTLTYSANLINITVTKINNTLATVTWTPGNDYVGNNSVRFTVSDGTLSDFEDIIIEVINANDPPTLDAINLNPNAGKNGTTVNVTSVNASDIDGDNLVMQCGDSSGNYNLCTSASGQPQLSCSFVSPWTDDTSHPVYCIVNDTQAVSTERSANFNADNTPPNITEILNVEGDTVPKYWDTDNDNNTIIQVNLSETNLACRWSTVDQAYSLINSSYECTIVGTVASCNVAESIVSQTNLTTRYISCTDQYGNEQDSSQNVDVAFGVDWTIPSINDDNDGQIHLPGYVVNLTINDEPSDVTVDVYYCNDTTNTCAPSAYFSGVNGSTASVTFNNRGTWYLRYNATDDAGNINETKSTIIFINNLPVISNQTYTDLAGHAFSVEVNVSDIDSSQNINCTLFHSNGSSFTPKPMLLVAGINSNGTWTANISVTDGYNVFETVNTYVVCNDTMESTNTTIDNHQIPNLAPGAPVVNITPDNPLYTDDLVCNITVPSVDLDSDSVTYYFQWYNNSNLIFTIGPTNQTSHTLGSGNTSSADVWNCTVIPYDGYVNGSSGSAIANLQNFTCPVTDCNITAPVINFTLPDYHKPFQPGNWTVNFSGYKYDQQDSGENLTWRVKGVNPMFMDVVISGDLITFAPVDNVHGVDKLVFELVDTDGLTDSQEIKVSINRSLYLFNGWNLFSVPILENKSVQYVLEPLTNGNWGCGHDDTPPFDCVGGDGDYVGNWTMLWTQDDNGDWLYFRPAVHYSLIPNQSIETLEVDQGYWIDMNLSQPINLTLEYS